MSKANDLLAVGLTPCSYELERPLQGRVSGLKSAIEGWERNGKIQKPNGNNLLPINLVLTFDQTFNAAAFKQSNQYYVAMDIATIWAAWSWSFQLFSTQEFIPEIGDASLEKVHTDNLKFATPRFPDLLNFIETPKCPVRQEAAIHLSSMMLSFLAGHELAHIVRGHANFLHSKTNFSGILESGKTLNLTDGSGFAHSLACEYLWRIAC